MRLLEPLLISGAALLLGCGGMEIVELERAEALWGQQSLDSYDFEYARSCECTLAGQALRVSVRSGAVSEVKRKDTGAVLQPGEYGSVPTIAELFATLDRASRDADAWSATYDAGLGYPRSISIDWDRQLADEETVETASGVTAR